VYAVCVIWPFRFRPTVGWIAGGLAALSILVQYVIGLLVE
jgi:hypothetical protein